ncbi:uncharacterized protein V1518DRAFT_415502 [Limtongia smithiae]|uniref:uncharacterized protein n=1 Tax=Limtongia smithiae TaxID=1125753 RepID=UPI0034CF5D04
MTTPAHDDTSPPAATIVAERAPETDEDKESLWLSTLVCRVSDPHKEQEGTQNAYISYLVSTESDFPAFQARSFSVRRRFSDFVYLYHAIVRDHPACAVPPLPDKQRMEYITGDRFGPEFTTRRASSLHYFLERVANHPILRRAPVLVVFLESQVWNSYMRSRPTKQLASAGESSGIFDGFSDVLVNAFAKLPKDKDDFVPAKQRADKLADDVLHTDKVVTRLLKYEAEWEADLSEFSNQFVKLAQLEPEMAAAFRVFADGVHGTEMALSQMREAVETEYVVPLRDTENYVVSVKNLLKLREQKQLDYEGLIDYLQKSTVERNVLASGGGNGFLRSRVDDLRGVDHNVARVERLRRLEARVEELTKSAEAAKELSQTLDKEVARDLVDFERIKTLEMKSTLGALAEEHIQFFQAMVEQWEKAIPELES